MGRMLLDFLSLYWWQNNSCKTTQFRTVFKFPTHPNASCSLRKRGMFNLHSTFCLKNEPTNEWRYVSLRLILTFVTWTGTLLWSVICCGPLWNRPAQPHKKQLDSRELSKLTQDHHNATWIHKQNDQEMEKVVTRYDVVERGKHREARQSGHGL